MDQSEKDEWIVVGRPKRKQIKKQEKIDSTKSTKIIWQTGKPLYLAQDSNHDLEQFISSTTFNKNSLILKDKIMQKYGQANNLTIHIECLGLGDFVKYAKPRYQFLFLKHLLLPVSKAICSQISVNTYDPIFSKNCIQEVSKLGSCLANNIPEQKQNRLIIFYMPHCQRFLYERCCQAHRKGKVLVIGNSLKQYQNRCELLNQQIPKCFLGRQLSETKLLDFKQSFNDTFCYYI